MNYSDLTFKKQQLDDFRPFPDEFGAEFEAWFRVELAYTSLAIDGNTLSRRETETVIEKGIVAGGKTLRENLEAANHSRAFSYLLKFDCAGLANISEKELRALHEIAMLGIDGADAGNYRKNPPQGLRELIAEESGFHPVMLASEAHWLIVSKEPFTEGNGRAARLFMNLLLMAAGYPPAIVRKRDRAAYLASFTQREQHDKLLARAAERSLDIYLKAARGESAFRELDTEELLKIGELAKEAGETVPTIRYWTKEGLLEVAEISESGYQFYAPEMVERALLIKKLKGERLTLGEIRKKLQ